MQVLIKTKEPLNDWDTNALKEKLYNNDRKKMYKKIISSAAWYSKELRENKDWQQNWNERELEEIDTALENIKDISSLDEITTNNFSLPHTISKLHKIQEYLEQGSGIVLLKGFPREKYNTDQLKKIFWGLSLYVGTPISQSAKGEKIFSVRDAGYPEGHPLSRGPNTKQNLSFHTDRCDVISFFCVEKAKSGGENLVASSVTIHNEILEKHPELLSVLYDTFYNKRHNVDSANLSPYYKMPIFSVYQGFFAANIMRVLIYRAHQMNDVPNLTQNQEHALQIIEEIAHNPNINLRFMQEPGDILFLNNFVTFHSRTEFEDYEEPMKKRHLLRIWLSVPNSRPLTPLFAPHYGNTNAGAIRGGMKPNPNP